MSGPYHSLEDRRSEMISESSSGGGKFGGENLSALDRIRLEAASIWEAGWRDPPYEYRYLLAHTTTVKLLHCHIMCMLTVLWLAALIAGSVF